MDSALYPALEVMGARYWGWLSAEHEHSGNLGPAVCLKRKWWRQSPTVLGGVVCVPSKEAWMAVGIHLLRVPSVVWCELFSGPRYLPVCCQLRLGLVILYMVDTPLSGLSL